MPGGRIQLDRSKITDSLTKGVRGLAELLDAIDQGRFSATEVFQGQTNINMALIAQRLGFKIADSCRTPDGNINRDLTSFTIVGRLSDIRQKVEEFKQSNIQQKLEARAQRLQPIPAFG